MYKPLCFVLMPFNKKKYESFEIDYDQIYETFIKDSIEKCGLEPIRADEEFTGGIVHKTMFERLILCEYAITDLSFANANVYYELGIRHAVRPYKTILLFSDKSEIPFNVENLQALKYHLDKNGSLSNLEDDKKKLLDKINLIKNETFTDSPLFQLFDELKPQTLDHEKTDIFRERVKYSKEIKEKLADARKISADKVLEVEQEIGEFSEENSGIIIDLFLSYRATKAWSEMIRLVNRMPQPLAERKMIQEQYAFALNRNGEGEKAEEVLNEILNRFGPSSETYGLLGRVYKDQWENEEDEFLSDELLKKAADTYYKGFKTDFRDAYPGINAITLMEIQNPPDEKRKELLPIVEFAVKQKIEKGNPDYWDYATILELAVLKNTQDDANKILPKVLTNIRESFEPETTARNLNLIKNARQKRNEEVGWIENIIEKLNKGK